MKKIKYLLGILVIVAIAITTVVTSTPALAAGNTSAPTAKQLISELQQTKNAEQGYALWNSFSPTQQAAVNDFLRPTSLSIITVQTPVRTIPLSNAITSTKATSSILGKTYTHTVGYRDGMGTIFTFSVKETFHYNGQIVISPSTPLVTGRTYRYFVQYQNGGALLSFAPGASQCSVHADGDFAFGAWMPWGFLITGHAYTWLDITYYANGAATYISGID